MKCISNLYGDKRDRTADPLLARQVLSQLSYIPFLNIFLNNSVLFALSLSHLHLGKLLSELRQAALIYSKILFNTFYKRTITFLLSYLPCYLRNCDKFFIHHCSSLFFFFRPIWSGKTVLAKNARLDRLELSPTQQAFALTILRYMPYL